MNIFDWPQGAMTKELTTWLLEGRGVRIERIVSTGQVSDWYDQAEEEFVILLAGEAQIAFKEGQEVTLMAGDTLLILPHQIHRVSYTSIDPPCLWICVFYQGELTGEIVI